MKENNESKNMTKEQTTGLGTASLVLGIIGLFFFPLLLGLLAVIFASIQKSKYPTTNAKTGFVLGIIDIILGFITLFIMIAIISAVWKAAFGMM